MKDAIGKDADINVFLKLIGCSVDDFPDDQVIWLDTDKIAAVCEPIPGKLGGNCFTIILTDREDSKLYIKNEYYDTVLETWKNN